MAANALLVAVPLHIAGVIASSVMHRENLVLAMITGRKPVSAAEARLAQSRDQHRHPAHLVQQGIAMLLLLALIGAGYGWVTTARRVAILSSTEVQGQLTGDTKAAADEIERGRAPNTLPR